MNKTFTRLKADMYIPELVTPNDNVGRLGASLAVLPGWTRDTFVFF